MIMSDDARFKTSIYEWYDMTFMHFLEKPAVCVIHNLLQEHGAQTPAHRPVLLPELPSGT